MNLKLGANGHYQSGLISMKLYVSCNLPQIPPTTAKYVQRQKWMYKWGVVPEESASVTFSITPKEKKISHIFCKSLQLCFRKNLFT